MMRNNLIPGSISVLAFFAGSLILLNCSDSMDPLPKPSVASIEPTRGIDGDEVTITGTNFSTTLSDNQVTFEGKVARVTSATATKLVVTAPVGGTTGVVTVTSPGGTVTGPTFRYYEVFVLGNLFDANDVSTIKIWKNGAEVSLAEDAAGNKALDMVMTATDLYLTGNALGFPVHWKNKTGYPLTTGIQGSGNALTLSGADVYVAGVEDNGSFNFIRYWKNGTPTSLTAGVFGDDESVSIDVINADIYVGGTEMEMNGGVAKYWKNGTPTPITDGSKDVHLNELVATPTSVYALYQEFTGTADHAKLVYWKDGTATPLTTGDYHSEGGALTVAGSDVLLVGMEDDDQGIPTPSLWINGTRFPLFDGTTPIYVYALKVIDNDIFMAGYADFGSRHRVAFFMINNTIYPITDGNTYVNVTDMFVR